MASVVKTYFEGGAANWVGSSYQAGASNLVAVDRLSVVREVMAVIRPDSLLDIGCGDGRFLRSMDGVARRVGLDYSRDMLDLAQAAGGGIEYGSFDFGDAGDRERLAARGTFRAITMMGLIHYLSDPLASLSALAPICERDGFLLVSARNRLFNISPASIYAASPLTIGHYPELAGEARYWSQLQANADAAALDDVRLAPIVVEIEKGRRFDGITDPAWNPEAFENWRQFSPLEAIILLRKAGFSCIGIYPLNQQMSPVKDAGKALHQAELLPYCSSILLVAQPI
jgi:SAM-dependent methyltransferase